MSPTWTCHRQKPYGDGLLRMCHMTHTYMWHDSWICHLHKFYGDTLVRVCYMTVLCICDMVLLRMCDTTHHMNILVIRPIHVCNDSLKCDMTHGYFTRRSLTAKHCSVCVTWLLYTCDMTHAYVWRDSLLCMCAMTQSYVCHDSRICVTWLMNTSPAEALRRNIAACAMTQSYVWHDSFIRVTWLMNMGWLRSVGSIQL